MKKPKSVLIRAALELGKTQAQICKQLNVTPQNIRDAKRRSATRGRPRVHTHPAEACAKLVERWAKDHPGVGVGVGVGVLGEVVDRIRAGDWKEYL